MSRTRLLLLMLRLAAAAAASAGVFSGSASGDFEVVEPEFVDASGAPLAAPLHPSRHRRAAGEEDGELLHLSVPFKGTKLLLELRRQEAPPVRVRRPVGPRHHRSSTPLDECHFRGRVRDHPRSTVALSTCDGFAGVMHSEQLGTLWIEPLRTESGGARRQHLVHRRSAPHHHHSTCGTQGRGRRVKRSFEDNALEGGAGGEGGEESRERHVEALVVADRSMIDFHDRQSGTDLETYLLTVMNMVGAFYRIPSLGNRVNVVVTQLRIVDEHLQQTFNVTTNADKTLDSFCAWQRTVNSPDDADPDHHDVAILLTRVDICSKSERPCGTLGVAHVGGMCDPDRACSVNQDNGLSVAHTIAHELGHNFGMVHDAGEDGDGGEEEEGECASRNGSSLHVMTPNLDVDTSSMEWSPCSRKTITTFFDRGLGTCLDDVPTPSDPPPPLPDLPPGALYDADHQCRLQYSALATSVCSDDKDFCSYLWCSVNGTCTTTLRPPADGTNCGHRKWCMGRACVAVREAPVAVHGGWGEWGGWGACSRSCGGGVSRAERKCDHPAPAHNGLFCTGLRSRFRICNTQPCPNTETGFRAEQCATFDPAWTPFVDKASPCALFCTNDSLIVEAAPIAQDGTPCSTTSKDMCIDGKCRRVGCDWRIDSGTVEDACGVCGGDGGECERRSGVFGRRDGRGLVGVAQFPVGARHIRVEEAANARTFLALGPSEKRLYVDGRRLGKGENVELAVAGSVGAYERFGHKEKLEVRGPTNESLTIFVVFGAKARNLGVRWEFVVRRGTKSEAPAELRWRFADWSACSATCGTGLQMARPRCIDRTLGSVESSRCTAALGTPPPSLRRSCNLAPCPAKWWSGPWQVCAGVCGAGRRQRTVLCVASGADDGAEMAALPDAECDAASRPKEYDACATQRCPGGTADASAPLTRPWRRHRKRSHQTRFTWNIGDWSNCSKKCGEGRRRREVWCSAAPGGRRVAARHCPRHRPPEHETCIQRPCEVRIKGTTPVKEN